MDSILAKVSLYIPKLCFSSHNLLSIWIVNNHALIPLTAVVLLTIYLRSQSKSDNNSGNSNSNNGNAKTGKFKVVKSEDDSYHNTDQTNIKDFIDFIVSENGASKDQRLADVLSTPLPPSGIKEVFLSPDKSSGSFKIKDLLNEVKRKSEDIRECEMLELKYGIERDKLVDDINLLKNQLEAEEQLRIQAESKSSLMYKQLGKLQKINSEHNMEREDLRQRVQQIRFEIELIDASRSDTDDEVRKVVAEIQAENALTKEEIQNLRETNKRLTQKKAHQRLKRDQLLKEYNYYKQQLSRLTLSSQEDDNPSDIEDYYFPDTPRAATEGNDFSGYSQD